MKRFLSVICIVLSVCTFLTACDTADSERTTHTANTTAAATANPALPRNLTVKPGTPARVEYTSFSSETYIDESAVERIGIQFLEQSFVTTLNYKKTTEIFNTKTEIYETDDGLTSITVRDQSLVGIHSYDPAFFPPEDLQTEAEYREWADRMLEAYYNWADLSDYRYSCSTGVRIHGEDFSSGERYDYFYTIPEDSGREDITETISSYDFEYRKYIGDYKTSDYASVHIQKDFAIGIYWGDDDFRLIESIEFDEAAARAAAEAFVWEGLTHPEQIEKVELTDPYLTFIDGQLCCKYSMGTIYKSGAHSDLLELAVFLEES